MCLRPLPSAENTGSTLCGLLRYSTGVFPSDSPCGHPARRQACARRPVAGARWVGRVLRCERAFLRGSRPSGRLRGAGVQADTRIPATISRGSSTPQRGAQRASRVRGGITMREARPGTPGSIYAAARAFRSQPSGLVAVHFSFAPAHGAGRSTSI